MSIIDSVIQNDWLSELTRVNGIKSKACKGFLFYLNCLLLILSKDSILFAVKKEINRNAIPSCLVLPA